MAEPLAGSDAQDSPQSDRRLRGCLVRALCVLLSAIVIAVGLFALFCVQEARARRWREVSGEDVFAEIETRFGCTLPRNVTDVRAVGRLEVGWERRIVRFTTSSAGLDAFVASVDQDTGYGDLHLARSQVLTLLEGAFDRQSAPDWLLRVNDLRMPTGFWLVAQGRQRLGIYMDEKPDGRVVVYLRTVSKSEPFSYLP